MKPSSRARLTRYTEKDFQGETLFDALGRAVCRAECLPRKEFFEAWAVARRVRRRLRGGPILELAAGHGLLSHMLLLLDAKSGPAVCVDRRKPLSYARLQASLYESWPQLEGHVVYREERLEDVPVPDGALIVSVHACGTLTDKVLGKAIAARARVAVLPCCQSTKACDTGGLERWLEPRLAIDVARAYRLKAAGFRITAQEIPADITPMNRLLIGVPDRASCGPPGSGS